MRRHEARKIAETITNQQIKQMLDGAKQGVKDWTKTSIVNKGCTKGAAWNILAKDFDITRYYPVLSKTNMVREFGEFLPVELQPVKASKQHQPPIHQDPVF